LLARVAFNFFVVQVRKHTWFWLDKRNSHATYFNNRIIVFLNNYLFSFKIEYVARIAKPQTGNEMLFNILRLYVNGWLWLTEHLRWITLKLKKWHCTNLNTPEYYNVLNNIFTANISNSTDQVYDSLFCKSDSCINNRRALTYN